MLCTLVTKNRGSPEPSVNFQIAISASTKRTSWRVSVNVIMGALAMTEVTVSSDKRAFRGKSQSPHSTLTPPFRTSTPEL